MALGSFSKLRDFIVLLWTRYFSQIKKLCSPVLILHLLMRIYLFTTSSLRVALRKLTNKCIKDIEHVEVNSAQSPPTSNQAIQKHVATLQISALSLSIIEEEVDVRRSVNAYTLFCEVVDRDPNKWNDTTTKNKRKCGDLTWISETEETKDFNVLRSEDLDLKFNKKEDKLKADDESSSQDDYLSTYNAESVIKIRQTLSITERYRILENEVVRLRSELATLTHKPERLNRGSQTSNCAEPNTENGNNLVPLRPVNFPTVGATNGANTQPFGDSDGLDEYKGVAHSAPPPPPPPPPTVPQSQNDWRQRLLAKNSLGKLTSSKAVCDALVDMSDVLKEIKDGNVKLRSTNRGTPPRVTPNLKTAENETNLSPTSQIALALQQKFARLHRQESSIECSKTTASPQPALDQSIVDRGSLLGLSLLSSVNRPGNISGSTGSLRQTR